MKVREIIELLDAKMKVQGDLDREIAGCYVSDMLSDVLANSEPGQLWMTQHTHSNVAAVSSVKDLAAVVVLGGNAIEPDTIKRADKEGVTLIESPLAAFEAAGRFYAASKKGES
jgi:hypothetical protein